MGKTHKSKGSPHCPRSEDDLIVEPLSVPTGIEARALDHLLEGLRLAIQADVQEVGQQILRKVHSIEASVEVLAREFAGRVEKVGRSSDI
jgi:hypothetical protein